MHRGAILIVVSVWSCAQPPTREIEMAAARLERARADGAALYANDLLTEAEAALYRAEAASSESGNHREAVRAAAQACLRADAARDKALEEKGRIHRLAVRLFKECQALVDEAHSTGMDPTERRELDSYSARVGAIQELLLEERVSEAHESAQVLKRDLLGLLDRLDEKTR